jgi:hypothetical protein
VLDAELTGIAKERVTVLSILLDAVRAGTGDDRHLTLYWIDFDFYRVAFAALIQPTRRELHIAKKRLRLSCFNIVIVVVGGEAG